MIEMMYVYQDEYMCRTCSRVKHFAKAKEIKDRPREWHAEQGASRKCMFCWAEKDPFSVQVWMSTLSKVFTDSQHHLVTFKGLDDKYCCLLEQRRCFRSFKL